jgi:hypothetical protein
MGEPAGEKRQVEHEQATGCAAASSVEGWKADDDEGRALSRTFWGRVILKLRGWVARLAMR